jgi:hypothetical protein
MHLKKYVPVPGGGARMKVKMKSQQPDEGGRKGDEKQMKKETKSWNPFVGCKFDCVYCENSYKPILQWLGRMHKCEEFVAYELHIHPERLDRLPPHKVIFVLSHGDISFCDPNFLDKVIDVMKNDKKKGRVFLLQSKNPACFKRILKKLPENVVLMTTFETNRDSGYRRVSKAPLPSQRFQNFLELAWPRKALVMEPILKFDLKVVLNCVKKLAPEAIFIGMESTGECTLPEPSPSEVERLHRELQRMGFKTYDKAEYKYRDVF